MRKKSPATIQKWVDSIAVDDSETPTTASRVETIVEEASSNCDSGEASTSDNLKGKLNVICSKLSVNEKLKSKKLDIKNLIEKTSQKLKRESSVELPMEHEDDEKSSEVATTEDEIKPDTSKLAVQRASHIGVLGRSSSENPNPSTSRNRRLTDIGRSFSVAHDNELPTADSSSENLVYDADEDISITIPSLNTSPSIISNNTNHSASNSQLAPARVNLLQMKPVREHTVSEGHQSPQVLARNPLLRDSSFQVWLTRIHC